MAKKTQIGPDALPGRRRTFVAKTVVTGLGSVDLTIESLTPVREISSLTTVRTLTSLTPVREISSLTTVRALTSLTPVRTIEET